MWVCVGVLVCFSFSFLFFFLSDCWMGVVLQLQVAEKKRKARWQVPQTARDRCVGKRN